MIKLLSSKKVPLPMVYLVDSDEDVGTIPLGIPFVRGNFDLEKQYIKLLEYEILLKSALASGLPFCWRRILEENGYKNLRTFVAMSCMKDDDSYFVKSVSDYLEDISYLVDLEYLKNLNLIPSWFSKNIEENIKINILNTILYNPNRYNKKLGLVSGDVSLINPEKNLIIIDISGSIPVSISKSILLLGKTMSNSYYADLLITGSKSTLYDYDEVGNLDPDAIYEENGKDNDQTYFKKIVSQYRKYNNVIVFGDNHSPGMKWRNDYNKDTEFIHDAEGKKLCNWEVNKIYSFHTTSDTTLAGYGEWFNTRNIEYMKDWVKDLN